jgi:DMSO/TMAO reductase YedYZ molybdopterin-dependent catalytic subunit
MKSEAEPMKSKKTRIGRREFLKAALAASAPLTLGALAGASARAADVSRESGTTPGLILREKDPENMEFPFSGLDQLFTPNEKFYIRSHFAAPTIEATAWRLKVEGAVEKQLELSLDDIKAMPSQKQAALLECAGNGRGFLVPKVTGVSWELGAVSTAEWTGVPVSAILEKAGLKKEVADIVFEGADAGEVKADPKSPGKINFARGLSVEKAIKPEVLLAYRMNDEALPISHGYPLRLIVPGWYGMASVKWLTRIVAMDKPFQGFYQTTSYSIFERRNGLPTMVPLTEISVKSEIARPAMYEVVSANTTYKMHGAAWSGESEVTKVEVSTDGGKTWAEAKLKNKHVPFAWRLWEQDWKTPKEIGRFTCMSRATDKKGRTQPMERNPDLGSYAISHVLPIDVMVR